MKYKNKKTGEIIDIEDFEEVKEPLRFGDIGFRRCFYCNIIGEVVRDNDPHFPSSATTTYPTEELAIAFYALRKLMWLRHEITTGRKPDLKDGKIKYCIENFKDQADACEWGGSNYPLSFPTEEMRDKFMEDYKDLIEKALPLI